MTLPRQWERHALALVDRAGPLEGAYFRSVELSYAHPDDVISGEGTRLYGGRFVRPGVRAVYGSADEHAAIREAAARKQRLAGRAGTSLADYPRITYVIAVKLALSVDLTFSDSDVEALLPTCLDRELADSHDIARLSTPLPQGADPSSEAASALGVAVPRWNELEAAILADLLERPPYGIGWWAPHPGTARRILISDQLYACAHSVSDNLIEGALHW